MISSPAVTEAAEHLIRRLQRFIEVLDRVKRQPNRREAYHALVALECLQDGHHERGEEAMLRAEHMAAIAPEVASQRGPHDAMTTLQLRGLLDGVVAGQR